MKNLLLGLILLISIVTFTSCEKNGPIITQNYSFSPFSTVSVGCAIDAKIYYGATESVSLRGSDNLLSKVNIYVDNGVLYIKMQPGIYPNNNIEASITIPNLDLVEIKGSGDIWIDDFSNLTDLKLSIEGSGDIKTGVLAISNTLTAEIKGSGEMAVSGTAHTENIKIEGSGDYAGFNLLTDYCFAQIQGSGDVDLNVTTDLSVVIEGSGDVRYRGQPILHVNISGSGDIINVN